MVYNKLMKGVATIGAVSYFAIGTAFAAGIDAGTVVSNEFTLTFSIGTTEQTPITNTSDPTNFVVDRRIDLATTGPGVGPEATPGENDYEFEFTFTNEGNDDTNFVFTAEDNGGTVTVTNPRIVSYWIDLDGNGSQSATEPTVTYTAGSAPLIAPDLKVYVTVDGDVPQSATNGQIGSVLFTATATNSGGTTLTGSTVNTIEGEETVLDDGSGVVDGNDDAVHTSVGSFTVGAAVMSGSKTVAVVSTDGAGCDSFTTPADTPNEFAIPGACVEYTITVANAAGGQLASNVGVADVLADELILTALTSTTLGGSFSSPASIPGTGLTCDGTSGTCNVVYGGGSLPAGQSGTVVIRARIKAE